jgi:hypothetical protein
LVELLNFSGGEGTVVDAYIVQQPVKGPIPTGPIANLQPDGIGGGCCRLGQRIAKGRAIYVVLYMRPVIRGHHILPGVQGNGAVRGKMIRVVDLKIELTLVDAQTVP